MGRTSIEWCDVSWPIVNGCRRASPGCGGATGVGGCYAERLASTRLSKTKKYGGLAVFKPGHGPQWTGESRLWEPDLDMPLKLRKPSKIFVADMGDLFYEGVSDEDIAAVFGVMALAPWHTYQVLTKRARRMREWVSMMSDGLGIERCLDVLARKMPFSLPRHTAQLAREAYKKHGLDHRENAPWPMPWVWLGVSVEDQKRADERIPELLKTPAAVRFVSYEPALDLIDFSPWLEMFHCGRCGWVGREDDGALGDKWCPSCASANPERVRDLHWIIVGGESGPGARAFDLAWARSVVEQCKAAGAAVFVKQLGAKVLGRDCEHGRAGSPCRFNDAKGGDWSEWPEDLRVREWPEVSR